VLLLFAFLPLTLAAQVTYSQDFDGFQVGDKIAAADPVHWRTWSDPPGPTEDAPVTDSVSRSGPNSLSFIQTVYADSSAPRDVVLLLGYHLTGQYVLRWSMYIHDDGGALITLLHTEDIPSAAPAAVLAFYPSGAASQGTMDFLADNEEFPGVYPRNAWFTVTLGVDLDASEATFSIDSTLVGTWAFNTMPSGTSAPNILGAVRFEAYCGSWFCPGRYHIDDVVFQTGTVGIPELEFRRPIIIVPNPSAVATVLSLDVPVQKGTLIIHDTSGRMVLQAAWPAGSSSYTLEAGALAPGTYVARVEGGAGVMHSGRLVVLP
jgi:hypothetical protein